MHECIGLCRSLIGNLYALALHRCDELRIGDALLEDLSKLVDPLLRRSWRTYDSSPLREIEVNTALMSRRNIRECGIALRCEYGKDPQLAILNVGDALWSVSHYAVNLL